MTWFVDTPDMVDPVVAGNRSRALGAGVDPFQYDEVTSGLSSLRQWLPAFAAAGRAHQGQAVGAEKQGRIATALSSWRASAVCWHVATTIPNPDVTALLEAATAASAALGHYLRLRGDATPLGAATGGNRYVGELRVPGTATSPPVVILVPGLDSSRTEFLDVSDALLARGVAVAAIDGPGQGALIHLKPSSRYQDVIRNVLDDLEGQEAVDFARVAVVGLSLGGLYAQLAAADEPRVTAAASISGPPLPEWDALPPFATDTLLLRSGSLDAAQKFTDDLHRVDVAPRIAQPLLVVSGTGDTFPTPLQAQALADAAPRGELRLVPNGDHLCGNARWQWLDRTADWVADRLAHP